MSWLLPHAKYRIRNLSNSAALGLPASAHQQSPIIHGPCRRKREKETRRVRYSEIPLEREREREREEALRVLCPCCWLQYFGATARLLMASKPVLSAVHWSRDGDTAHSPRWPAFPTFNRCEASTSNPCELSHSYLRLIFSFLTVFDGKHAAISMKSLQT